MTIIKADDVLMRMLIAQAVVDDGDIERAMTMTRITEPVSQIR